MKDFLKNLPQILSVLPGIISVLKYIPILMLLGGIGYAGYFFFQRYQDPYKCYNNEIYERMSFDSGVYKFKGGYCVEATNPASK